MADDANGEPKRGVRRYDSFITLEQAIDFFNDHGQRTRHGVVTGPMVIFLTGSWLRLVSLGKLPTQH